MFEFFANFPVFLTSLISIIEKTKIEDLLALENQEDFIEAYRRRLIEGLNASQCFEQLVPQVKEWLKTTNQIPEGHLDQTSVEMTKAVYKNEIEKLKNMQFSDLPAEIIEVFNTKALKVQVPNQLTTKNFVSNLYKNRDNEPSPNDAASVDILLGISDSRYHLWQFTDYESSLRIDHSDGRYIQLQLFGMDSSGNFIPVTDETANKIVGSFDLVDKKIIRLLLMRCTEHCGQKFEVSFNWILDLINDKRKYKGGKETRQYLSRREKLLDIERRIKRYRILSINIRWHEGKGKNSRIFNLAPDGSISQRRDLALFLIPDIYYVEENGKFDGRCEIIPGKWFQISEELKQYTWFPKKFFQIDTYKHQRAFSMAEYVLIQYRRNRKNLILKKNTDNKLQLLKVKIKTLIDEIINPVEIEAALKNPVTGTRLKQGIIQDTQYLSKQMGWEFFWEDSSNEPYSGINFADFKETAAFTVKLSDDLESLMPKEGKIRQKKLVTPKKNQNIPEEVTITGKDLKQARKKAELTQKELAKKTGYSSEYISLLERGVKPITSELQTLFKEKLDF